MICGATSCVAWTAPRSEIPTPARAPTAATAYLVTPWARGRRISLGRIRTGFPPDCPRRWRRRASTGTCPCLRRARRPPRAAARPGLLISTCFIVLSISWGRVRCALRWGRRDSHSAHPAPRPSRALWLRLRVRKGPHGLSVEPSRRGSSFGGFVGDVGTHCWQLGLHQNRGHEDLR